MCNLQTLHLHKGKARGDHIGHTFIVKRRSKLSSVNVLSSDSSLEGPGEFIVQSRYDGWHSTGPGKKEPVHCFYCQLNCYIIYRSVQEYITLGYKLRESTTHWKTQWVVLSLNLYPGCVCLFVSQLSCLLSVMCMWWHIVSLYCYLFIV